VEGLGADGSLHPLQEAFADLGAAQCGYCTPAILVTAKALLDQNAHPSRDQIREALSGNLCRCTPAICKFLKPWKLLSSKSPAETSQPNSRA